MSHKLMRIKASIGNKPHLIEPTTFASIVEYLNDRNSDDFKFESLEARHDDDEGSRYAHNYNADTRTGIMYIDGPLTYRTSGWEAFCGGTSYEMMKEQMELFVDQGAKTVAMLVDSGGGEAHAMMDSANYIRKLADENGVKIIAYVDGMSASAAYGISCIADEIVMSTDSQVGSIGVLIQLINNSEALKKAGYERTFVTAGKDKVPYAEDGSFTKEFIDKLQAQVDELYEGFTAHVANHREIDLQVVKDTEANVFTAKEALSLGLADKVMTVEDFHKYLATEAQKNLDGTSVSSPMKRVFKLTTQEEEAEMAQLDEMQARLDKMQETIEMQTAQASKAAEAITALTSQLATATASLKEVEDAKANAELHARKAALAEVLPEDQVESKLSQYASLDKITFDFIVGELASAKAAKAESFKASGEDTGAETVDRDGENDPVEQIRKAGVEAAKAMRR